MQISVLPNNGEIEPASLSQVIQGKGGRFVEIDDDVGNVVRDLQAIDPRLRVRWSEAGEYFVVYMREDWQEPGDGYLVTTAVDLDQRVVERIRKVSHESYDYTAEIERLDREAERAQDQRRYEQVGEIAERLAHALRKERGFTNRAFITEGPDGE